MKAEETIDFHIRRTWHAIARMYNEQASQHGGTMSTGFVLLHIDINQGTPSTKLGPLMGMEPHSLSRTLKTMEEKDLIYRKKDPTDGRGVLICLTEYGMEKREAAKASVLKFNNVVFNKLSEDQARTFFKVMRTINELIDNKSVYLDAKKNS